MYGQEILQPKSSMKNGYENKRKADGIYPGTLMRCMAYLRSLSANLQRYPMDESDQSNSKY